MSDQRFKVEVILAVSDAETGEAFAETKQTWESMGYASLVGVEKILHAAQGELITWAEESVE